MAPAEDAPTLARLPQAHRARGGSRDGRARRSRIAYEAVPPAAQLVSIAFTDRHLEPRPKLSWNVITARTEDGKDSFTPFASPRRDRRRNARRGRLVGDGLGLRHPGRCGREGPPRRAPGRDLDRADGPARAHPIGALEHVRRLRDHPLEPLANRDDAPRHVALDFDFDVVVHVDFDVEVRLMIARERREP